MSTSAVEPSVSQDRRSEELGITVVSFFRFAAHISPIRCARQYVPHEESGPNFLAAALNSKPKRARGPNNATVTVARSR